MKNMMVCSMASLLMLSGCGGNDHSDTTKAEDESSYLIFKGDGINETLNFDNSQLEYTVSATGNQPISWASFNTKDKKGVLASVSLNTQNNEAYLFNLIIPIDQQVKSLFCFPPDICKAKTTYLIKNLNNLKNIQITLENAPNGYFSGDPQLIDIHKLLPVTVSGTLNFFAQSNWPIFQTNRFPKLQIQGKILFDGQEYEVKNYGELETTLEDKLYSTDYHVNLKNADKTINLRIKKYEDITSKNTISLRISDDVDTYEVSNLSNEIWSNLVQGFKLNLDNLELTSLNGKVKNISSNIYIPFDHSNLTVNNATQLIAATKHVYVATINDQKQYQLSFKNLDGITITQELKGHLSASMMQDDTTISCGDRNTACAGLTVDNQKQNFTFNNVKIGSNTLNGTYYFAGVFE